MKQEDLEPREAGADRPGAVAAERVANHHLSEPATEKDPDTLRRDIEQTREELGDTVEALSKKADVKAQLSQRLDERKAALRARQEQLKAKVESSGVAHKAEERPFPAVAIALAIGLLLGWLWGRR